MSIIKVTLPPGEMPAEGKQVSFKAPCTCAVTEAIQIEGENYTVCDALGKPVTGIGGIWDAGSIISTVLSLEQKKAYIQNGAAYSPANKPTAADLGAAKVEAGWYTGTNTYGSGNPTRISFSFDPKIIFVMQDTSQTMATTNGTVIFYRANPNYLAIHSINETSRKITGYYSNKTLSFYAADMAAYQQNSLGTYSYVAIG